MIELLDLTGGLVIAILAVIAGLTVLFIVRTIVSIIMG